MVTGEADSFRGSSWEFRVRRGGATKWRGKGVPCRTAARPLPAEDGFRVSRRRRKPRNYGMSILGSGKRQHRLLVVQVKHFRLERGRHGMPQTLSGEVLFVVLDLPLSGMRFQYLLRGLQGKMPSPVGREDCELRHSVVGIPPQVRVRAEHREPDEDVFVVDEVRATPRIREILLKVPVMQVPELVHLVRVEHRHLIQVLLVDIPEQVAVVWLNYV